MKLFYHTLFTFRFTMENTGLIWLLVLTTVNTAIRLGAFGALVYTAFYAAKLALQ